MESEVVDEAVRDGSRIPETHDDGVYIAPPWKQVWWKFKRHRVAVVSAGVVLVFYALALFAEFFAPYLPNTRDTSFSFVPPQRVRIFDEQGLTLPFVYGLTGERDMESGRRTYHEDRSVTYRVRVFARGESYKLWGLFPSSLHLIGVEEGGRLYLWGTDSAGRDVLSNVVHGARVSLSIGLLGVLFSLVLGIIIGGVSGYFGGVVDNFAQRFIEIIRGFPSIALWMALSAAMPTQWTQLQVYMAVVVILSMMGWTSLARAVRGKMISIRDEDFVLAARLNGAGTFRVLRLHMVPSFTSHIIATLTLAIPGMIIGETSLSFIGLGLSRPIASWGVLLQQAQNIEALRFAWWLFLPGVVLVVTVLAFNFLGDGLRDAADPYSELG